MPDLDGLKIQPVGDGLIDLICPWESVEEFIRQCDREGLAVTGFTWWCHVTGDHRPCGMGGPRSEHFDGWFSELAMDEPISFENNSEYLHYLKDVWPGEREYRPCLWPGFWLEPWRAAPGSGSEKK